MKRTICALLIIASLSICGLTQTNSQKPKAKSPKSQNAKEGKVEPLNPQKPTAEPPATLDEKLGPDDGAAIAILVGGNMRGNMGMCDCSLPRGGLGRRIGFVEAFKKKFKETAILQVESGFFWYDSTGFPPAAVLQNEQMARAYSHWPIDVINMGRFDLVFAQRMLAKEGLAERMNALPMLKNLISANGIFSSDATPPPAYVIKDVKGPRIKGAKNSIRIGFVGLAEPIRPAEGIDATVKNIYETAKQVIPQARKECDVLIVVAHAELGTAAKIAEENPQVDVVIAGNPRSYVNPRQVGNTYVVCSAPGNTQHGGLKLYIDDEGRITYKYISVGLDETVPADPEAAAYAEKARQELDLFRQHR